MGRGGKMNPRIRLTSAKVEVGVEVEAELGNTEGDFLKAVQFLQARLLSCAIISTSAQDPHYLHVCSV